MKIMSQDVDSSPYFLKLYHENTKLTVVPPPEFL